MLHLLVTAGRTLGKQDIINRVGISPRSHGLVKNAIRRLMTTGEENLRFSSRLELSTQNIKPVTATPKPRTNYALSFSICLWMSHSAPSTSCGTSF